MSWRAVFLIEGLMMAPLALICFCVPYKAHLHRDLERRATGTSITGAEAGETSRLLGDDSLNMPHNPRSSIDIGPPTRRVVSHADLSPSPTVTPRGRRPRSDSDKSQGSGPGQAMLAPAELGPVERTFWGEVRRVISNPLYFFAVTGYGCYTFVIGGFSFWCADYLHVTMHQPENTANIMVGGILVFTGLLGTSFGGTLADKLGMRVT